MGLKVYGANQLNLQISFQALLSMSASGCIRLAHFTLTKHVSILNVCVAKLSVAFILTQFCGISVQGAQLLRSICQRIYAISQDQLQVFVSWNLKRHLAVPECLFSLYLVYDSFHPEDGCSHHSSLAGFHLLLAVIWTSEIDHNDYAATETHWLL